MSIRRPLLTVTSRHSRKNAASISSSSAPSPSTPDDSMFVPVYVHHVSKTVLECMQTSHHDWLMQEGLDRGLRINSNGTFVLQFPSKRGFDSGRIWTSYDAHSKNHWLSVYRNKTVARFLLKDGSVSTESHEKQAVEELIATLK